MKKKGKPIIIEDKTNKDKDTLNKLDAILTKYPNHKAMLALQNNYNKFEKLNSAEKLELERIYKLLIKD